MLEIQAETNSEDVPSICEAEMISNLYCTQMNELIDYEWPLGSNQRYFVQSHVGRYLNIKSLHRKFADLDRRSISLEEKDHLRTINIITSMEYDFGANLTIFHSHINILNISVLIIKMPHPLPFIFIGLVALSKDDVIDLMIECFPQLYREFLVSVNVRQHQIYNIHQNRFYENQKKNPQVEGPDIMKDLMDTIKFNSSLNKLRSSRKIWIGVTNSAVHAAYQLKKLKRITQPSPNIALVPNQYASVVIRKRRCSLSRLPFSEVISDSPSENCEKEPESSKLPSPTRDTKIRRTYHDSSNIKANANRVVKKFPNEIEKCKSCDEVESTGPMTLIHCSNCKLSQHAICAGIAERMLVKVTNENWQCYDCKCCQKCNGTHDDDKMLFCDFCDAAYHSFCTNLKEIPIGRWSCSKCGVCTSCGARRSGSTGWIKEVVSLNQSEKLLQILCSSCSRLFRDNKFCPICLIVYYRDAKEDEPRVKCSSCGYTVHKACYDEAVRKCAICSGKNEDRAMILKK